MASRTVSVYLSKDDVADYEELFKDRAEFRRIEPEEEHTCDPVLFVKPSFANAPRWWVLLDDAFTLDGIDLRVRSASAVVALTVERRIFALAFGHGHTMLDEARLVHDFGLKVCLGTVSPDELRNVDMMRPETTALRKRHQTGRSSRMDEFEIDQLLDVVRSVTGRTSEQDFASKITGTNALKLTADLDFSAIPAKCTRALDLYESNAYQENFALIDNLRPENDPSVIEYLDQALLEALLAPEYERIHLSPPEILDQREIVGFKYRARRRDPLLADLLIQDYANVYAGDRAADLATLKRHKVHVQFENQADLVPQWPLYKCMIFETLHQQHQYILAEGNWYRVDSNFKDRVTRFFQEHLNNMILPAAQPREFERNYCSRIAKECGLLLFDRQTFRVPGEAVGYELCDLLHPDGLLLHTKPYRNGSGTLSHLFRQGEMAGELFCREPEFRHQARDYLGGLAPHLLNLIPDTPPNAREYTMIPCIIAKHRAADPAFDIPFFSKVSFQRAARRLGAYGYSVDLCFIERMGEHEQCVEDDALVGAA